MALTIDQRRQVHQFVALVDQILQPIAERLVLRWGFLAPELHFYASISKEISPFVPLPCNSSTGETMNDSGISTGWQFFREDDLKARQATRRISWSSRHRSHRPEATISTLTLDLVHTTNMTDDFQSSHRDEYPLSFVGLTEITPLKHPTNRKKC